MKVLLSAAGLIRQGPWLADRLNRAGRIIAVDGGLRHVLAAGHVPHLLLGDLDSVDPAELARLTGTETVRFPADKDATDLELALERVQQDGASCVTVAGAMGLRNDHGLTNLLVAARWHRDCRVPLCLAGDGTLAWPLRAGEQLTLPLPTGSVFSVTALAGDCRVSITGARYSLHDRELPWGSGLGLSNVTAGQALVHCHAGLLVVMAVSDEV